MAEVFTMLGASFTLIFLLMIALWVIYLFQRNAGIVDLGWPICILLAAWSYFFLGQGNWIKIVLMTAMVTIWACRLFMHLYKRYDAAKEDPRYTRLRAKWGGSPSDSLFLMLFVFQGLLTVVISLPFFFVAFGSTGAWSKWEFFGIVVWWLGIIGETFADRQLQTFNSNPENHGKVLRQGLWRFSRHPNYFFELLVWIGFFLFALPAYAGIMAIISPIVMLILLTKVSGVPLAEEEALVTKGEDYREYQRTTSVFIPWIPGK